MVIHWIKMSGGRSITILYMVQRESVFDMSPMVEGNIGTIESTKDHCLVQSLKASICLQDHKYLQVLATVVRIWGSHSCMPSVGILGRNVLVKEPLSS